MKTERGIGRRERQPAPHAFERAEPTEAASGVPGLLLVMTDQEERGYEYTCGDDRQHDVDGCANFHRLLRTAHNS